MSHVFGPIPSRRLGRSLGVDPVPLKTCNWNCVYCQLGRTGHYQVARAEHVPTEELLRELREALATLGPDDLDWVTFSGSGEPTLHSKLGELVREAKRLTAAPVAVLTNGYLLSDPRVREELVVADAVMPTVSAGTEDVFLKLHRPAKGVTFDAFVEGLLAFRACYPGSLWAEVMVVEGVNDDERALADLVALLRRVRPDEIHVTLPSRPPSEAWVHSPSTAASTQRVVSALQSTGIVVRAPHDPPPATIRAGQDDPAAAIVDVVQRHPMTDAELVAALADRWPEPVVVATLAQIERDGVVEAVQRDGRRYYRVTHHDV